MTKKISFAFLIIVTLLAFAVRYVGRNMISEDMLTAFLPWFDAMKDGGGLAALSKQVGDYGLLFQTVIALLTYIDANPVYLFKIVSVFFDFLLAISIAYFVTNYGADNVLTENEKRKKMSFAYAYVLLLPTVVMNSAFWGQCDSIYTFFLLWSVWFLYKEKYILSFFALGWSLAFKLQAVLLFPLFVYYYFSQKKFSLLNVLITPCTFWFSGIVVYIYRQRSLDSVGIYSNQVAMFERMWMNVPSFWCFFPDDYERFHVIAICLTFVLLGIGFLMVLSRRKRMDTFEKIIGLAVFIEWTCIVFLPAMHERYTYVMDLLLLVLFLVNWKYFSYTFIAVFTSYLTYTAYLFTNKGLSAWIVLIYILFWIHYCYTLFIYKPNKLK